MTLSINPAIANSIANAALETRGLVYVSDLAGHVGTPYVFMPSRDGRFYCYDATNPYSLALLSQTAASALLAPASGVARYGTWAYVASEDDNLGVFDISNPSAIAAGTHLTDATNLHGAVNVVVNSVAGVLYVAARDANAIAVYSLASPGAPSFVTLLTHANISQPQGLALSTDRNTLWVACLGNSRLVNINTSTPTSPSVRGSGVGATTPSQVCIHPSGTSRVFTVTGGAADRLDEWSTGNNPASVANLVHANFDRPLGVVVNSDGLCVIGCQGNNGVLGFANVSVPGSPAYLGALFQPVPGNGIALDPGEFGSAELYHNFQWVLPPEKPGFTFGAVAGSGRLTSVDLGISLLTPQNVGRLATLNINGVLTPVDMVGS